jgi:hypothetical protein
VILESKHTTQAEKSKLTDLRVVDGNVLLVAIEPSGAAISDVI